MTAIIGFLIWLVVFTIVAVLVWWALNELLTLIPATNPNAARIKTLVRVLFLLVIALIIISWLYGGLPGPRLPWRG